MKINVVIVTYKNRWHLLKQVLDRVLEYSINRVIIVDNNSHVDSKRKIEEYKSKNEQKIKIISIPKNAGSAYAFKVGIMESVMDETCEYIWLLDDDNVPEKEALTIIKEYWISNGLNDKKELYALSSLREMKQVYCKALKERKPWLVPGKKNIFRSFHIFDLPELFLRKFKKERKESCQDIDNGEIEACPYGGLFFHRDLIQNIGYPDDRYFVYMDDFDFSHRIISKGGKIIILTKSIIRDVETSWNLNKYAFISIAKDTDYSRLYYAIRNRVYFEKKYLVDNYIIYLLNMFIYTFIILVISIINFKLKNITTYFEALWHGLKGVLGENVKYKI